MVALVRGGRGRDVGCGCFRSCPTNALTHPLSIVGFVASWFVACGWVLELVITAVVGRLLMLGSRMVWPTICMVDK